MSSYICKPPFHPTPHPHPDSPRHCTVFALISLRGPTVECQGPPPGAETGSAAAFIIITSATTEIRYLRLISACTNASQQQSELEGRGEMGDGDD